MKKSYLLQLTLKDSCIVHVRLPIGRPHRAILNMFNIGWRPPNEALTADAGSGTHSYWPTRQHRGTVGVSDRLMWSGHYAQGVVHIVLYDLLGYAASSFCFPLLYSLAFSRRPECLHLARLPLLRRGSESVAAPYTHSSAIGAGGLPAEAVHCLGSRCNSRLLSANVRLGHERYVHCSLSLLESLKQSGTALLCRVCACSWSSIWIHR